jgi:hypothetical protein
LEVPAGKLCIDVEPIMDEVVASMSDADACCKLQQDLPLRALGIPSTKKLKRVSLLMSTSSLEVLAS